MAIGSDYCPILLTTENQNRYSKRQFCFETYWASDPECREVIDNCWRNISPGPWIDRWTHKLKDCRSHLISWSKQKYQNRRKEIDCLLKQLDQMQYQWAENQSQMKPALEKLNDLWSQEESHLKQRSRIRWLHEGDSNTSFFHHSTIQRRRQNRISGVKTRNGAWAQNCDDIRRAFEEQFIELFKTNGNRNWGTILDCVIPVVTEEMNMELMKPVSTEEVKEAAFQMGGSKAPGPDGFNGVFYHNYWEIIRHEIQGIMTDFLSGSNTIQQLNSTQIVLVPKVANPELVTQYRPISLCNYSYKILSKVLANRLNPLLQVIISPTQNAFVPTRQIQDNILVAHEVFHYLKLRKSTKKFEMGVKLDMNKAYDRVEWDFLGAVMAKMGFAEVWIQLIMNCVKSVRFAVVINGKPGRYFSPSRGIR